MCAIHGCSNVPIHKATLTAQGCPPTEIEICDEHWAMLNGKEMYSMGCRLPVNNLKDVYENKS
jgi:hypothetical protein